MADNEPMSYQFKAMTESESEAWVESINSKPNVLRHMGGTVACLRNPEKYHLWNYSDAWDRCCKDLYCVIEIHQPKGPYFKASLRGNPDPARGCGVWP